MDRATIACVCLANLELRIIACRVAVSVRRCGDGHNWKMNGTYFVAQCSHNIIRYVLMLRIHKSFPNCGTRAQRFVTLYITWTRTRLIFSLFFPPSGSFSSTHPLGISHGPSTHAHTLRTWKGWQTIYFQMLRNEQSFINAIPIRRMFSVINT